MKQDRGKDRHANGSQEMMVVRTDFLYNLLTISKGHSP